jgi:hypothetical protein
MDGMLHYFLQIFHSVFLSYNIISFVLVFCPECETA